MEDVEIMGTTLENYAKEEEIAQRFVPNPSLEHRATYEEMRDALIEMANWKDESTKKEQQQSRCLDYGRYTVPKNSFIYKDYNGLVVVKPKYQVGDIVVKHGRLAAVTSITDVNHTHYTLTDQFGDRLYVPFQNLEGEYMLATNIDSKILGSKYCRMCSKFKLDQECTRCVNCVDRLSPDQKEQLTNFINEIKKNASKDE